jgi:hypothetical protein
MRGMIRALDDQATGDLSLTLRRMVFREHH